MRKRVQRSSCAVCGARCQARQKVELCYWSAGVWLWCDAVLCRPCRAAVVDIFKPRQTAWAAGASS